MSLAKFDRINPIAESGNGSAPGGPAGGDLTGTYPNPQVDQLTGAAGVVNLVSGTTIQQTQGPTTPANVTGTADITSAALYGVGGTLNGKGLRLIVSGVDHTLVFNGAAGQSSSDEAHMLAAIAVQWPGLTATDAATFLKLVDNTHVDNWGSIDILASTALVALGLVVSNHNATPVVEIPLQVQTAAGHTFAIRIDGIPNSSAGLPDDELKEGWNPAQTDPSQPMFQWVIENGFDTFGLGSRTFEAYWEAARPNGLAALRPIFCVYDYQDVVGTSFIELNAQGGTSAVIISKINGIPYLYVETSRVSIGSHNLYMTSQATLLNAVECNDFGTGSDYILLGDNTGNEYVGMRASTGALIAVGGPTIVWVTGAGLQLGATTAFGGGVGVMGVANAATAPTTNPGAGGILYSSGGQGAWRRSDGTVIGFG